MSLWGVIYRAAYFPIPNTAKGLLPDPKNVHVLLAGWLQAKIVIDILTFYPLRSIMQCRCSGLFWCLYAHFTDYLCERKPLFFKTRWSNIFGVIGVSFMFILYDKIKTHRIVFQESMWRSILYYISQMFPVWTGMLYYVSHVFPNVKRHAVLCFPGVPHVNKHVVLCFPGVSCVNRHVVLCFPRVPSCEEACFIM